MTVASLAADFRHALDPCAIARDVGIEPDPWQAELLEEPPARVLMCCGRQVGKSTASSLIALNAAIYQAPALILMVSPSLRQSVELYRRLHGFWERLPGRPEAQYETLSRLELANGSRILSLPGSERTVRGISAADLIILDEAAGVEDELLAAIRPMLAISDGKMFALTTPKGKRGWFYEQWLRGVGWHRFSRACVQLGCRANGEGFGWNLDARLCRRVRPQSKRLCDVRRQWPFRRPADEV